jgi:biopolymer transport protein TolQ
MHGVIEVFLATIGQVEPKESGSMLSLILEADIIVQFVLLVLVLMSVGCWVIILNKITVLRKADQRSQLFLDAFWKSKRLDQVYDQIERYQGSPVAQVFKVGYHELTHLTSQTNDGGVGGIALTNEDNLERALRRARITERTELERMMSFLATTGSTGPFIGLFGTVWGILRAFQKIDVTGQATIQTVGGDISHALIATAVGLAAAIPAVMAFNYFNRQIRVITNEMDTFSDDFLNIIKRHFVNR